MTKSYFYARAYGTGRSQVILMSQREGYYAVLRQALLIALIGLPRRCLRLVWAVWQEDSRTRTFQELAFRFGFLYQATGLLLLRKDPADSEAVA